MWSTYLKAVVCNSAIIHTENIAQPSEATWNAACSTIAFGSALTITAQLLFSDIADGCSTYYQFQIVFVYFGMLYWFI